MSGDLLELLQRTVDALEGILSDMRARRCHTCSGSGRVMCVPPVGRVGWMACTDCSAPTRADQVPDPTPEQLRDIDAKRSHEWIAEARIDELERLLGMPDLLCADDPDPVVKDVRAELRSRIEELRARGVEAQR